MKFEGKIRIIIIIKRKPPFYIIIMRNTHILGEKCNFGEKYEI